MTLDPHTRSLAMPRRCGSRLAMTVAGLQKSALELADGGGASARRAAGRSTRAASAATAAASASSRCFFFSCCATPPAARAQLGVGLVVGGEPLEQHDRVRAAASRSSAQRIASRRTAALPSAVASVCSSARTPLTVLGWSRESSSSERSAEPRQAGLSSSSPRRSSSSFARQRNWPIARNATARSRKSSLRAAASSSSRPLARADPRAPARSPPARARRPEPPPPRASCAAPTRAARIAAADRSTSSAVVRKFETEIRIACSPSQSVPPSQHVPSSLHARDRGPRALAVAEAHEHLVQDDVVQHRRAAGLERSANRRALAQHRSTSSAIAVRPSERIAA